MNRPAEELVMNRRGSVLQPSKDAHPLDQLEEVVVKVTTFAALGFLGLLVLLGAVTGDTVTVTASGPDAKDAIAQVTEILQSQED